MLRAGGNAWWQRGSVYQIYPRSFADSSGDGVGDLRGITDRLGYLAWLGVDAVWISPIYPSPMADFGYDITDHTGIDPVFGTLGDFDALLGEAHRLGLRVLLDYVPNHTSVEHPWFVEARASRDSARRDWYLWRDPGPTPAAFALEKSPISPGPNGQPPNNWRGVFGGSAWTLDERSGQFYYHAYLPEQPDLNWRHPPVREAMLDVLRFWLDRGVDGFRIDAPRHLLKDAGWRDNPANPDFGEGMPPYDALLPVYSTDLDAIHDLLAAMRSVVREHGDPVAERLLIGELYVPIERLVRYYGRGGSGLQMPSNMHLIACAWRPAEIAALIERYEAALPDGAWPNWVLGNHDRSRIASRVGGTQARVAAMLLLTLRGTPTLYYGDELGMTDVPIRADRVQDPYQRRVPELPVGRDPQRTPMPWTAEDHAGFCPAGTEPWLPIASDHARVNVAAQRRNSASMLALYRRLFALRRTRDALTIGTYRTLEAGAGVLAYVRSSNDDQLAVALNLTDAPQTIALSGRVLLSTWLDREHERASGGLRLRADEGVVFERARA
jgi:alpha-glucosidase